MAALSESQLAYLHAELGAAADEDDLQERYDRLGSVVKVADEVIRGRLADLLAKPASFTLTGVMSRDLSANIRALQPQADRLTAAVRAEDAAAEAAREGYGATSRLVRSDRGR